MNKAEKERYINIRNDLFKQARAPQKLPDGLINRDDPDNIFNILCPPDLYYLVLSKEDYVFIKPFINGVEIKEVTTFEHCPYVMETRESLGWPTLETEEKVYITLFDNFDHALKLLFEAEDFIFRTPYKKFIGG